jgi:hypothetical protein
MVTLGDRFVCIVGDPQEFAIITQETIEGGIISLECTVDSNDGDIWDDIAEFFTDLISVTSRRESDDFDEDEDGMEW